MPLNRSSYSTRYTEHIRRITPLSKLFVLKMPRIGAKAESHAVVKGGYDVSVGVPGALEMIDTFDRPGTASAAGTYAGAGTFAEAFENKPGKRIPKAGVYAGAGVGHARAEWSVFDAEAKGPNASAGAGASAASLGARAFARAEVASASASAGPVKATVGLSADTGVGVGLTGVEAKVLGTGFSFGRKMGISLFGTGFEFNLW
ncbi:fibroin heavy chain-like [Trachinotus anak]|uniref:fibroin heavy chain-like n=1 Tax=Trachinotus anak TaxID=443729 RepID=UPI0039F23A22